MEKITFDTGIKTYQINDSGVLKFNPSDPNLYKRFKDLRVEIEQIQKDYNERSKTTEEDAIDLLAEYDARWPELYSQRIDAYMAGGDGAEISPIDTNS